MDANSIIADVDECLEETHKCNNMSNCVDMEGSYDCTNENETTTTSATAATGIINRTHACQFLMLNILASRHLKLYKYCTGHN